MNIDDFPFNDLITEKRKGEKEKFNSLISKVHMLLLSERNKEWEKEKGKGGDRSGLGEVVLTGCDSDDAKLLMDIMNIYMKMGCVEKGSFHQQTSSDYEHYTRWLNSVVMKEWNVESWIKNRKY